MNGNKTIRPYEIWQRRLPNRSNESILLFIILGSIMKWKIRRYGRSYIYDRLHRATVTVLIGLSVIGFIQIGVIAVPVIKNHIIGEKQDEATQVKQETSPS